MNKEKAEMPIFYTYVYLDSRKSGKFQYHGSSASFLFEPIYVGKTYEGSGRLGHFGNSHLSNKMKKIVRLGYEVIMFKLSENLTEREAFNSEIVHIAAIGREDRGLGSLCNKTDGGEGLIGYIRTEEEKQKISERQLGEGNPIYNKKACTDGETLKYFYEEELFNNKEFSLGIPEHLKLSRANYGSDNGMFNNGYLLEGEKNGIYGKPRPPEVRRKISESKKCKPPPNKGKKEYTDGKRSFYFLPDDPEIAELNLVKGRPYRKRNNKSNK